MVEKLIGWCAKHKFAVLLLTGVWGCYGIWTLGHQTIDAIPDLSDTQVIIYSKWDRSPDLIEAQVTYPIASALLGAPKLKAIRGYSDFGFSYIYVLFEDGTDIYWARSRVLEYLNKVAPSLPSEVKTEIGPDATGVGWVFQYALVDESGKHSLADLRSFQDWNLRYLLQSVPGVAEVATIGGFEKQYQVTVDPYKLQTYNIPLMAVVEAVRRSNLETGGRLIEFSGREHMIRGRGYIEKVEDLERIALNASLPESQSMRPEPALRTTSVLLRDVARVEIGPQVRRGVAELDGRGEVVGGVVIMRHNENALQVIRRLKEKLREIESSLLPGTKIVVTYDRSELIEQCLNTLKQELIMGMIIVSLMILLFLRHFPSAAVPILTIPVSVLLSFIPMHWLGVNVNIMSMAGIVLSIGVLVDGAIVEVENAYRKLALWMEEGQKGDFHQVRLQALQEVGPSVFFSLLLIAAAFLPVFALVDQEGKLFRPLAYSKTFVMIIAAIMTITLDPALRMIFSRMDGFRFKSAGLAWVINQIAVGRYLTEEKQLISRFLFKTYEPLARLVLKYPKTTIMLAMLPVLTTIPVYFKLGREFMPPFNEGTILYMPTTFPGISVAEAFSVLQKQNKILKTIPEVERAFGKAGRAETSTDPAPFSMIETTIVLKPRSQWRHKRRWYSNAFPEWMKSLLFRRIWEDRISYEELIAELDQKVKIPGVVNAWTMPIKGRTDMLTTGVRTSLGIKVLGPDLMKIQEIGIEVETLLKTLPETQFVNAERVSEGSFLDFRLNRDQLARYGLSVGDVQDILMTAVGGETVTTVIEGRARYTVNVRYPRELRDNLEQLNRLLVQTPNGDQVPISSIAEIRQVSGPTMIRDENGVLAGYVFAGTVSQDIGGYVDQAKQLVREKLSLPPGYSLIWSGQYENMLRVRERLKIVIPFTLLLIIGLLYLNTKSMMKTSIVLLAVPFSLIGAIWLMFGLGYSLSIASWVGMIALMGLDAETGVFMLLFLDLCYEDANCRGLLKNKTELQEAVIYGAVRRVRPKMMTVTAAFMGLMPVMWSTGAGADLMKRVVCPLIGGLASSFALELLVYPPIYFLWKWHSKFKDQLSNQPS